MQNYNENPQFLGAKSSKFLPLQNKHIFIAAQKTKKEEQTPLETKDLNFTNLEIFAQEKLYLLQKSQVAAQKILHYYPTANFSHLITNLTDASVTNYAKL